MCHPRRLQRADLLEANRLVEPIEQPLLLGLPMLRTDEVNERVFTGEPASEGTPSRSNEEERASSGNLELARGRFVALAHSGSGTAAVVELSGGGRKLTLTDFETDNGPDLRVYVSTEDPARRGEVGAFEDLGALKGNVGDQQYDIPKDVDLRSLLERGDLVPGLQRRVHLGVTRGLLNR